MTHLAEPYLKITYTRRHVARLQVVRAMSLQFRRRVEASFHITKRRTYGARYAVIGALSIVGPQTERSSEESQRIKKHGREDAPLRLSTWHHIDELSQKAGPMWYDLIPINGGPSYTWKNVRGGEKSMTVRAEGRWTGIAQLGHSQHHIALENKYPLDWPQKNRNQKQCCSFQQLQPQSTALKEKDAQARCEDPTPTKNMPISGKSAIVQAYNARYLNERVWVHVDGGRLMKQHSSKVGMNLNI
ncbi:hypothetical protein V8E52_006687 [Russula decolorans]